MAPEKQSNTETPSVEHPPFCDDEWSPLHEVIVGRAEHSCFPPEPSHMMKTVCPSEFAHEFRPDNPFPPSVVANASFELDNLARVLESHGVKVHRPENVNWEVISGYTGAMARDGLMVVGNHIIESCYAWKCRRNEIELAYGPLLSKLAQRGFKIIRAPAPPDPDTIYDGCDIYNGEGVANFKGPKKGDQTTWAINNSRPAFDVADFVRFGKTVFAQLSNVTNQAGLDYVAANLPESYTLRVLNVDSPWAMHIDTTLVPLRKGLALYDPRIVTEEELRRHPPLDKPEWRLVTLPFKPEGRSDPPLYMTSPYICMNVLSLDEKRVFVDEKDEAMAEFFRELGLEPILIPFRHVQCLGGSFHCATVDLIRE
ncbi:hypothetical protein TWF694_007665 [Orbilia ellipsospora]|uniref:Glycine amidinotransferase, mitochondrial n=1 Tax=Orbilia ellipsospora TaxID=2528407 RepID=A0AAV9XIX4_9PEZI